MNRLHDTLPSRRLSRWIERHNERIAWAVLSALSATMTYIAWKALIA